MMDRKGFLGFIGAGLAALSLRKELEAEEATTDVFQATDAILEVDGVEVQIEPKPDPIFSRRFDLRFGGERIHNVRKADVGEEVGAWYAMTLKVEAYGTPPEVVWRAFHENEARRLDVRPTGTHAFVGNAVVLSVTVEESVVGTKVWRARFRMVGETTRAER